MKTKPKYVASKELTIRLVDEVFITDPCYNEETVNQGGGIVVKVRPGLWGCRVLRDLESGRVHWLMTHHIDHEYIGISAKTEVLGSIGVDSGQAGIFDADYYRKNVDDKQWYSQKPCRATSTERGFDTLDDVAVVSASGWGDGCYVVYGVKDETGTIVNLTIVFAL